VWLVRRLLHSTLFPYTTLFRSSLGIEEQFYLLFPVLLGVVALFTRTRRSRALAILVVAAGSAALMALLFTPGVEPSRVYYGTDRSEEHTSELQSRENIVCRLLL